MPNEADQNNPWENWNPKTNDIDLGEVVRYIKKFEPLFMAKARAENSSWSNSDIRAEIEKEYEGELALTGQIAIVKGKEPTIAIAGSDHDTAIHVVYDIHMVDLLLAKKPFYADVEVKGKEGKVIKARFLSVRSVRPPSSNHFLVSEGLKDKLEITNGETIRVLDIYQDVSSVDLDKLL